MNKSGSKNTNCKLQPSHLSLPTLCLTPQFKNFQRPKIPDLPAGSFAPGSRTNRILKYAQGRRIGHNKVEYVNRIQVLSANSKLRKALNKLTQCALKDSPDQLKSVMIIPSQHRQLHAKKVQLLPTKTISRCSSYAKSLLIQTKNSPQEKYATGFLGRFLKGSTVHPQSSSRSVLQKSGEIVFTGNALQVSGISAPYKTLANFNSRNSHYSYFSFAQKKREEKGDLGAKDCKNRTDVATETDNAYYNLDDDFSMEEANNWLIHTNKNEGTKIEVVMKTSAEIVEGQGDRKSRAVYSLYKK